MIVNNELKYVFISVPKTGSLSIQYSLGFGKNVPAPEFYHQGIARAINEHPECADYFKFAFIRNPWARLVSLYKDFTVHRIYQYSEFVKHDKPLFGEFKDFEDFCINVKSSYWWDDIFLKSQTNQLSIDGILKMDFIGRFEQLQNDFNVVCSKIGVPYKLLRKNIGKYDNSDYRKYYTEASRKAVTKMYLDDIESFKYEF